MKKIFIALMIVLAASPLQSAFAATSNFADKALLFGKSLTYHSNWSITEVTDGKDATRTELLAYGNAYTFNSPLTPNQYVDQIYIRTASIGTIGVKLYFADNSSQTYSVTNGAAVATDYYVDVSQTSVAVKSYEIYRVSGSSVYLTEFDLRRAEKLPDLAKEFAVSGVKFTKRSTTDGTLSWTPISSPYFKKYIVYKDGKDISSTTESTYPFNNLSVDTEYTFKISAVDVYGREFSGETIQYRTPKLLPVPVLSGSTANGKALLSWSAADDDRIRGYYVYQNDVKILSVADKSTKVSGLKSGGSYKYTVAAYDGEGNVSKESNSILLEPGVILPPVTANEQEATAEYLLVTWTETEDAVGYEIYLNNKFIKSVGPDVRSYKITRAMGYNPSLLVNRTAVRAVFADGTKGESGDNQSSAPIASLGFISVGGMIDTSVSFLKIYGSWILLVLAVIFGYVFIGPITRWISYAARKSTLSKKRGW